MEDGYEKVGLRRPMQRAFKALQKEAQVDQEMRKKKIKKERVRTKEGMVRGSRERERRRNRGRKQRHVSWPELSGRKQGRKSERRVNL